MGALSDQLLVVTILAYVVAMVCHAAEYAFAGRPAAPRPDADLVSRQLVAVGAAADPAVTGSVNQPPAGPRSTAGERIGWLGVGLGVVGVLAHLGTLVTRGVAAGRMPWGNMYEFILTVTFVGAVSWLVVLAGRPQLRRLGLFVALVLVGLLGAAGMAVYVPVGPLVPALDSYWFVLHVSSVAVSSGIFTLAVVPAAMYLVRSGYDDGRRSFPYSLGRRLPGAGSLERLTFGLHAFAFPIWTFGALIAGPVWAEAAWGRYWGWDPKEVWAFISWVVYAGYLHARATPSVRRSTAIWIAVFGWATMLMNLFGVNLFFEGLHSYAK